LTAAVLGSFLSLVFVLELVHLEDVLDPLLDHELLLDDELLLDETDMIELGGRPAVSYVDSAE
jgi:hypothetical protein